MQARCRQFIRACLSPLSQSEENQKGCNSENVAGDLKTLVEFGRYFDYLVALLQLFTEVRAIHNCIIIDLQRKPLSTSLIKAKPKFGTFNINYVGAKGILLTSQTEKTYNLCHFKGEQKKE